MLVVVLEVGVIPFQFLAGFAFFRLLFAGLSILMIAAGIIRALTVVLFVIQWLVIVFLFNLLPERLVFFGEGELMSETYIKRIDGDGE